MKLTFLLCVSKQYEVLNNVFGNVEFCDVIYDVWVIRSVNFKNLIEMLVCRRQIFRKTLVWLITSYY